MAARSKFTPAVTDAILQSLRQGAYAVRAAEAAGVSEATYYRWLDEGKDAATRIEAWEQFLATLEGLSKRERTRRLKSAAEQEPTDVEYAKREFREAVTRAEAEGEQQLIGAIQSAALGKAPTVEYDAEGKPVVVDKGFAPDWRAAAHILERRYRERWGRRDAVDVHTHGDGPTDEEMANMSPEDLAALAEGRRLAS